MYRINLSFTKVSKISGYSSSLEFKLGPDCLTGAGKKISGIKKEELLFFSYKGEKKVICHQ